MTKYITIGCITLLVLAQMYLTGKWTMFVLFPIYGVWRGVKAFVNGDGKLIVNESGIHYDKDE